MVWSYCTFFCRLEAQGTYSDKAPFDFELKIKTPAVTFAGAREKDGGLQVMSDCMTYCRAVFCVEDGQLVFPVLWVLRQAVGHLG